MPKNLIILLLALTVSACQVTPEVAELQSENAALQNQLSSSKAEIEDLKARENELYRKVQESQRVKDVLAMEKTSRVQESSELRSQARNFVQQQIDDLKAFLVTGDLLDYVGSELIERQEVDQTALALVDLAHPIPRTGSLTGVSGYFTAPTDFRIKVLRPIDDKYMVIWQSDILSVVSSGESGVQLPVSVGVEPGDVIAYIFPEATNVSFDKGTGDTRYTDNDLALGEQVKASSLAGAREKRAYSLGVFAILE